MHMTSSEANANEAIRAAIEKANARKLPLFDGKGVFRFEAFGEPIAEGSMIPFWSDHLNRCCAKPDDPRLERWRLTVRDAAARAMNGRAPVGRHKPLLIGCIFRLPLPEKGKPGSAMNLSWPTLGKDFDKLVRAVGDALTGTVYADDGQLVGVLPPSFKRYVQPGERPGVVVRIAPVAIAQAELFEV